VSRQDGILARRECHHYVSYRVTTRNGNGFAPVVRNKDEQTSQAPEHLFFPR
jgi:hypothetical protein